MAPLMALAMFLALLGGVFSVDLGLLYDGREQARVAADLSTLAAVQELPQDENYARVIAFEYAAQNGFDQCPGAGVPAIDFGAPGCDAAVTVSVLAGTGYDAVYPDTDPLTLQDGECERPGHCVLVQVQRQWDWLFGGLLGLSSGTVGQVGATAVAMSGTDPREVMVVLDRSGSMCFDIDGGVSGGSGSGNGGCETASKNSLVGLDMTSAGSLNFSNPVGSLGSLNVGFAATNPSRFTINGVLFTYNPAAQSLNAIATMINASAANVTASFSTGSDARLTISSTVFGGGAQINIDDVDGNFFFATRMLDANLARTKLVGRDVGTLIAYPGDLNEPLADLNSFDANFDVDFTLVPGGSTFCINGVTGVEPCTGVSIPYTTDESLNTIITRINAAPGAGVVASFASDVFTLTRTVDGPVPISIADGAGGNFLQAMRLLQVPTLATAVGGDMADCTGPGGVDACFDAADLPVPISTLNDELLEDLVPVPPLGGAFSINGATIQYGSGESLNEIIAKINASVPANVTATIQTGTDQLVLTQKTAGSQPIVFGDVVNNNGVGNFLQGMRFVSPVRRTSIEGLNVEGTLGSNFDVANDLTVALGQLDDELEIDFAIGAGRLCIRVTAGPCDDALPSNGAKIDYTAADAGGSTLTSILADINNPANGTGVIASINGDRLTLRRNMYGPGPIVVDDITGSFFSSMRLRGGTKSYVVGGIVGNLSNANLGQALTSLNTPMTVDFANVPNGGFEINDVVFTFNAATNTISQIITAINASAAADVTASFDTNTDKFMLTRDTIGPLDITYSDLSGNFFQAMQFLANGSATTVVGLDVGDVAGDIVAGDLNLALNSPALAAKTVPDFTTPGGAPAPAPRIRINGIDITYSASSTVSQVIGNINASNAAVTASFDTTTDTLTLTRNAAGATDITFGDVTGNFFQVMRYVSGGGLTTAVGQDVDTGASPFDDLAAPNNDLGVTLVNLNDELDVDFVTPGSFLINGVTINYTAASTLNTIKAAIDGSAAGVTATYNTGADTLTLTNNAPGAVDITFSDTTGNFFRAMKFLAGSRTTAVSGPLGGFNEGHANDDLDTVDGVLTTDLNSADPGSFTINGATITYDSSNGTNDSLDDVIAAINASVDADVTAAFDAPTDRLIFTRKTFGDLPIDMVDVVGNFLHAFRMVAPPTYTTVVGLDVGDISTSEYEDDDLSDHSSPGDLITAFLPVTNGSLTINGVTILYNAQTDELDDLVAYITNSAANVTASFDTGTDQFTLTQKTPGSVADITYNDNVGNFFAAMQLLNPGTRTTAVSGALGGFNEGDLGDDLDTLAGELNPVDLQSVANGEFLINGASIAYSSAANTNDSLNDVITRINDSVQADVTASFNAGTDRLVFTRDSYGPLLITMQDVTGNFLEAFRMVGGTYTTVVGLDVAECGGCDISPSNGGNDDPNDQLIDLNEELSVPFAAGAGSFTVNGTLITYNTASDTLNSVLNKINNGVSGVGPVPDVTASFDANDPDVMRFVHDTAGNLSLDLVDVTGNFLQALRLLTESTHTTVVGLDVAACGNCDIQASNGGDDDLNDQLIDLNEELDVPFVGGAGSFIINGTTITYSTASDTLNTILNKINNGAGGVGPVPNVTASFDTSDPDVLTLRHDLPGNQPLDVADGSGNFLRAMRLITQSGGSPSTVDGADVGTLVNADSNGGSENLNTLDALLDVDVQRVSNGRFLANGVSVSYDALNDTLAEVMTSIGTTPGTGVTAAFVDGGNFLRLTAVAPGAAPITFSDVTGNFLEAMKLATSTRVALEGADVSADCVGVNCPLDAADLTVPLAQLNEELNTDMIVPGSFSINGVAIPPYSAASTLATIMDSINATSAAGVVATIDTGTNKLKLTRTAPGPLAAITVSDLSGNFFQAMRFLAGGSRRTAVGYSVGTLTQAQLDYPLQMNGSFTIRGVNFTLNPANPESIQDILDRINADAAADVTATFDLATGRLTVTRDTIGGAGLDLTFSGAFMHSMGMVSGAAASTTIAGGDVGAGFDQASDLDQRLSSLNGGFLSAASFSTAFDLTDSPRTFSINGQSITYCPRQSFFGGYTCDGSAPSAANTHSTLNTIRASIDLVANGTGVTAVIDVGSADQMRLTRSVAGPLPIVLADGPNGANFLDAMQMLDGVTTLGAIASGTGATLSGAAPSGTLPTLIATPIAGTAPTYVAATPGTPPVISYASKTLGASGGATIPGTVTPGTAGAILAIVTPGTLGGGYLGTKTLGGVGGPIAIVSTGAPVSTLATTSLGGAVTVLAVQTLGTDATELYPTFPGLEAMVGNSVVGVVPGPGLIQNVIAGVTPGLDASDLLAELQLGDDPAIGHLIATFTLSNHRPLDVPPVYFWAPLGPVQRAAGLFSNLTYGTPPKLIFQPGIDQMGLASFASDARLDLGLDDLADGVPNDQFGIAGSDFENKLLGLVPEGRTNIGGGICMAVNEMRLTLADGGTAPYGHGKKGAEKIIVLLSDGEPNETGGPGCPVVGAAAVVGCTNWGGTVPNGADEYSLYLACIADLAGITIHTIGLGAGINEDLMREIAAVTGGQYFDANTSDDLDAQFEAIATILGIALVR